MHRYVHKGHSLTLGRDLHQFTQFDKDDILITLDFDHSKRQIPGTKQGLATETFKDLRSTFTPEQVQTEAKRCLGCGTSVVDPNKCIDVVYVQLNVNLMQSSLQEIFQKEAIW